MISARGRGAGATLGYVAAYVAALVVGRQTVVDTHQLAAFWPAAGVAALWLMRARGTAQLAMDTLLLLVATVVADTVMGVQGLATLLLFAAANAFHGLVVRWCAARLEVRPFRGELRRRLASTRDLLDLGATAIVASLASAPLGLLAAWASTGRWSWWIGLTWVVRNGSATLVVVAAALAVMTAWRREADLPWRRRLALTPDRRPGAAPELAVVLLGSLGIGLSVFTADTPIAFVLIVSAVWIGLRFSPVVGTLHTLGIGALAVTCTVLGLGPWGAFTDQMLRAVVVQLFVALHCMITLTLALGVADRTRLLARARASEARATSQAQLLHAVTTTMAEGIAVLDADRCVVMSNPAVARLTGLTAETGTAGTAEDYGFSTAEGHPLPLSNRITERVLRGERVVGEDLLRVDPESGAPRMLEVSAVPLHLSDRPEETLALLVVRDVSEQRAHQRELEGFAGVVAHDLKTPLNGVKSWAELLGDQLDDLEVDTSPARRSLAHVRGSAERMQRLIDDLLAFTLSQSADLRPRPVDLDQLVDDLSRALDEASPTDDPQVLHERLGWVEADPMLVRQLMANLLSNAVKYVAPETTPRVVVAARRTDGLLEVSVSDNGIGIPTAERRRVFDSFYRVAGRDDYTGTGLGLAICARAVERHGGGIAVHDGPGGLGTTVVFTLPAATDPGTDTGTDTGTGLPRSAAGRSQP